jgi:hypothetical protein
VPVVKAERAVRRRGQRTTSGAANRPTAVGGSASRVSRRTAVLRVRRDLPTPGSRRRGSWSHWIRRQDVDGSGTRLPTDRGRATTREPGDLTSVAGPGVPAGQWSIERAWPRQRQVIHGSAVRPPKLAFALIKKPPSGIVCAGEDLPGGNLTIQTTACGPGVQLTFGLLGSAAACDQHPDRLVDQRERGQPVGPVPFGND